LSLTYVEPSFTGVGQTGKIVEVNLPEELEAGQWITGSISVKNVGDAYEKLACLIHTLWDDAYYGAWQLVGPGVVVTVTIPEELIRMPGEDAEIEIYGGVLLDGWDTFRRDDMRTHTVKLKAVAPLEWWMLAAIAGGAALLLVGGAVAYQEHRRREELMLMLMR